MPRLVLPSVEYKKSFLEDFLPFVALDYDSWGKYYNNKKLIKNQFPAFVKFIRSQSKGKNLPAGYIPHTVFWLTDSNKMLGSLSLRHKLTPNLRKIGGHIGYEIAPKFRGRGYGKLILKLGLKKAKLMGMKNVLLTCDPVNLRSKKMIESNGGKFEGTTPASKKNSARLRYWLKT